MSILYGQIKKRNELIRKYMYLAESLAKIKKRKILDGSVSYDELQSAAYLGLIDAANRYDESKIKPDAKDPFKNYASQRIFGEMSDYLRSCIWMGTRYKPVQVYSLEHSPYQKYEYIKKENIQDKREDDSHMEKRELFYKIIRSLPPRIKKAFLLYYIDGKTMKDIGKEVGLSESRISQLLSHYTKRLKKIWENKKHELYG